MTIKQIQTSNARDASDHYGIETSISGYHEFNTIISKPTPTIKVELTGFHCLEETNEVGDDEIRMKLIVTNSANLSQSVTAPIRNGVASEEQHFYSPAPFVVLNDPGQWISIAVEGTEIDDWPNPGDLIGKNTIVISRNELLEYWGTNFTRGIPRLMRDGGEYVPFVRITVG